ncbi:hypothetical protein [Streptomyces sp. H27-C3]|uniref:hypothetical protein n=1 Tax=Streptomyces sp. H27-C3 TaxID=3046305 RepID=UPI0024BAA530|nr:hypothetical protein [Streptomyces sp. H27-C3]MDJ0464424.1 hypothetical protein [Streptomyces sp. H27-C3]
MITPEDGNPLVDDYACRLDFQSGWVDLTMQEGTRAEAESLVKKAVAQFNPLKMVVQEASLVKELTDRALEAYEDGPILVAAYCTEGGGILASLEVDSYGEPGVPRPSPAEVQPQLLEWANAEVIGEPEVAHPDLRAGRAVRVQSMLKTKRMLGFGRRLTEFIKYAVFPPETSSVIVATVRWEAIQRSEELALLTDELVSSMRLVPLDAGGKEISTDLLK